MCAVRNGKITLVISGIVLPAKYKLYVRILARLALKEILLDLKEMDLNVLEVKVHLSCKINVPGCIAASRACKAAVRSKN